MKLFTLLILALLLFSCSDKEEIARLQTQTKELRQQNTDMRAQLDKARESEFKLSFLSSKMQGIKATIVTNKGNIELKFYPDVAPIQCFNFITRAESGFYNNTQFHRVIPGFMIQGGDPNSAKFPKEFSSHGSGGPLVNIPNEFNAKNHKRGILSTARTNDVSAGAGSQFFIMHADNLGLDNKYTVFGETTSGLDVVDAIANVAQNNRNHPLQPVIIKTINVYR